MYIWTRDLETGNEVIDSQHKGLFEAVNQLLNACSQGRGRREIQKMLLFLQDYTARHFHDEEAIQLKYRYPQYMAHRKYHEEFKRVVQGIVEEYEETGPTVTLVGKINSSVGGWLLNHIKQEDVKVASWVREADEKR